MTLDSTSIVSRSRDITATEVDSELVMMDHEQGRYYGLNAVATEVWRQLEKPIPVATLCQRLEAKFDVDSDTCRHEVLTFLKTLDRAKLLATSTP